MPIVRMCEQVNFYVFLSFSAKSTFLAYIWTYSSVSKFMSSQLRLRNYMGQLRHDQRLDSAFKCIQFSCYPRFLAFANGGTSQARHFHQFSGVATFGEKRQLLLLRPVERVPVRKR